VQSLVRARAGGTTVAVVTVRAILTGLMRVANGATIAIIVGFG